MPPECSRDVLLPPRDSIIHPAFSRVAAAPQSLCSLPPLLPDACAHGWEGGREGFWAGSKEAGGQPAESCGILALQSSTPAQAPPGSRGWRQPLLGSYPWGQQGKGRRAPAPTGEYSGEPGSPLPPEWALMLGKTGQGRNYTKGAEGEHGIGAAGILPLQHSTLQSPSPSLHTPQSLVPKFISTCRLPCTPGMDSVLQCKTTLQRRVGSVPSSAVGVPGVCVERLGSLLSSAGSGTPLPLVRH